MRETAQADDAGASGYRQVGGELVSCRTFDAGHTRFEMLRRKSSGPIAWRFRQPTLALFWFRHGVDRMQLRIDDRDVRSVVAGGNDLALFPPSLKVDGEFHVKAYCDYAVAFFDPALIARSVRERFDRPLVGFGHGELSRGFENLCHESRHADPIFDLYAEGWAMQAVGQLARLTGAPPSRDVPRGGLSRATLSRIREFIAEDLSRRCSIDDLSTIAGLSRRHFMRAFQQSVGLTPHRFVQRLRIDRARALLAATDLSMTEIALTCGFSHAQHFSTGFRAATGVNPSSFRRNA